MQDNPHIITDNPFQGHTIMYLRVVEGKLQLETPTFPTTEDIECEVVEPNIKLIEEKQNK